MATTTPQHRLRSFKGRDHVAMKQLGTLIFAARVNGATGVWAMAQGIFESQLRRRPLT